jgi:gliding motility-associated-like protein
MSLKSVYIVFALLLIASRAMAQHDSKKGFFSVDQKKGCEDLTVTITNKASHPCDGGANPCNVDWGDGTSGNFLPAQPSHTYQQPGDYLLQLQFKGNESDGIEIDVVPNTPPEFDVYLCGANRATVKVTDQSYDQYVINYGDGSPDDVINRGPNAQAIHLFLTPPGLKTISVKGRNLNANDNCTPASEQITTIGGNLTAPTINQLEVLNKDSIQLDFTTQSNILYRLEIAVNSAAPFQLYRTIYNTASALITDLKPDDNFYCFRLTTFDPCNNATFNSNVVCSSNLDLTVQNNSNNLTWITSAAGVSDFRMNRTTSAGALSTTVTGTSYSDTNINCGTEYCYRLTTNYPNGSRSISIEKCGTAISTDIPETVQNITAVVNDPGVTLQWEPIPNFTPKEFSVFRSLNGAVQNLLSKTADFQIADESYQTLNATCYIISYEDVCGNTSLLSAESCPMQLTGKLNNDNSITLNWRAYTGWRNGVNAYTVEKYSMDGQLLETFSAATNTTLLDESQDDLVNQRYRYVVKANSVEAGLPQALSNSIVIIKSANIFYPTAFTPNGDNLNDLFNVFGQYIVNFEMSIFNRWGELVFNSTALEQGWDGTFRSNPMPEGTYTFVAEITDRAGRSFKKSGSVLLLRKN